MHYDRRAQKKLIRSIGTIGFGALAGAALVCGKIAMAKMGIFELLSAAIMRMAPIEAKAATTAFTCSLADAQTIILTAPLKEEFEHRGIQTVLELVQDAALLYAPPSLRGKTLHWLTSPQARVLVVTLLFAAIHLNNAGGYGSTQEAIAQMVRIALIPTYSALQETTGSWQAPLAAHMTNNALGFLLIYCL